MGEHWQVARSLPKVGEAAGLALELWVASAGYGLLHPDDPVKPYAATFTPGLPDAVVRPDQASRYAASSQWWSELALWAGPRPGNPRSLRELVQRNPSDYLVVALGARYLDAVADDIMAARNTLSDPGILFVISAGTRSGGRLGSNLIPVDSGHQQFLGGTRLSLNARAASWLVATSADHGFDRKLITRTLEETRAHAATISPSGRRISDEEVSTYIRGRLGTQTTRSRTTLLRDLRRMGMACEQTRFAEIFVEVTRAR